MSTTQLDGPAPLDDPTLDDAPAPPRPEAGPNPATSPEPRPRRSWWRRWRGRIAAIVVFVIGVTAIVIVSFGSGNASGTNNPRSTGASGTAAISALLSRNGVSVRIVDTDPEAARIAGATLVISNLSALTRPRFAALLEARPERVVVMARYASEAAGIGLAVRASPEAIPDGPVAPGCSEPVAVAAGPLRVPSPLLRAIETPDAVCYGEQGGAGYLRFTVAGVPVHVITGLVSNQVLAQEGNAAFGLNLMGHNRQLVWLYATNTAGAQADPFLPQWFVTAMWGLALAVVVVAIWRGRRFGPILDERLPVVVKASETVEGAGRLYMRIQARDQAARHLRAATLRRLSRLYGPSDPAALAEVVAARVGRATSDVRAILAGPDPTTDAELLQLRQALDTLEQEARQP